jgi:hypothetical protein
MPARDFARFLELAEAGTPREATSTPPEKLAASDLAHVEASIAWTTQLIDELCREPGLADRED